MDSIYKSIGFKETDPIDKIECTECGSINDIPLYVNVGRYCPMIMWCWNCFTSFKYWRYYGCHKFPETEGWFLSKVVSERTNGKIIEKEIL